MNQNYYKKGIIFIICLLLTGCNTPTPKDITTSQSVENISLDSLYSKNAIFMNLDTNTVLFSKKENTKVSPASLTKIMSAIIAIEYYDDYSTVLSIEQSTLITLQLENSSLAGFSVDEEVTVEDLLYGTLLSSGGEATLTLADDIAGNEDNFVDLMNKKVKELQMTNTHFTNACGFDHKNHYSTTKDISTLLSYCLQNETFKKIFTTEYYMTAPSIIHSEGIRLQSTMFENLPSNTLRNGTILGGKTGYTEGAGLCLASYATINGTPYIFVSTNAKGDHNTPQYNILDAIAAYQSIES